MESEEGPSQLLNSLMKEVNEKQWEMFKKSRKSVCIINILKATLNLTDSLS
jgi:hypothetical protein